MYQTKRNTQLITTTQKIRTGQSFLYRKNGFESMVLEFRLTSLINPTLLKNALDKSLQRFDYLTQELVEIDGDFYFVKNTRPLVLRNSANFLPLGGAEVNYHLLDIHFTGKTLFIDYHHGLCDGRGILPFARTLLYYYFSMKENAAVHLPNVLLAQTPYLENELEEPGYAEFETDDTTSMPNIQKQGYSLPEAQHQTKRMSYSYKTDFSINTNALLGYAKKIGATPAIAIAILLSQAIDSEKEDAAVVNCNLVADLRAGVHMEHTHRNCVSSLALPYPLEEHTFDDLAQAYRQQISAYKQPENLRKELQKVIHLSDQLDQLPSFEEKQQALGFFETLLSDTYTLSYIGQLNLGIYEQFIESIHTYSSGSRGLTVEVIATKENFYLDMMQSFTNERYSKAFARLLTQAGIAYQASSLKIFSTPKDHLRRG